jgi:hypothetical protein
MNLVGEYLENLEEKIKQLAEDHYKIKSDNDILTRQTVTQQQIIETQKTDIENLIKQVQALKFAKSVESTQETTKVKDKIQDLVREIDRCIELLNK